MVFQSLLSDELKDYEIYSINENHLNEIVLATNQGVLVFDGDNIRVLKQENSKHFDFFFLVKKGDGSLFVLDIDAGIYKVGLDSIIEIHRYKKNNNHVGKLFVDSKDKLCYAADIEINDDYPAHPEIKHIPGFKDVLNIKDKVVGLKTDNSIYVNEKIVIPNITSFHSFVFNDIYYYRIQKFPDFNTVYSIDTLGNHSVFDKQNWEAYKYDFRPSDQFLYINDTERGVLLYNKQLQLIDSSSLNGKMISTSYSNPLGREWLGTFTQGLWQLADTNVKKYEYSEPLMDIERFENRILISTESNRVLEFKDKTFEFLDSLKFDFKMLKMPYDKDILIFKMFLGSNFHYNNGAIEPLLHRNVWIQKVNEDLEVRMYREGVRFFTKAKDAQSFYTNYQSTDLNAGNKNPMFVLPRKRNETFYYDTLDGSLITGGIDDILVEYPNRTKLDTLHFHEKSIHCSGIIPFKDGFLLFTKHDGFYLMKNKVVTHHFSAENDYLLSNNLTKLEVYNNHIFISHEKGIEILDENFKRIRIIRKSDGLLTQKVSEFTVLKDDLYVISEGQLIVIPWKQNTVTKPTIHKPFVRCNNKILKEGSVLKFSSNYLLTFHFKGVDVLNSDLIAYKYRIKGLSDKWETIKIGEPNKITLYGLEYGYYEVEVLAENCMGDKSSIENFSFTIKPPFYSTWWFRVLVVLIIGGIAVLIFKYYSNKKEKELFDNQLKKQLAESQLSALRSQMNPHFIFNALNSIQSYIMLQERVKAGHYLTIFSNLIREYLMQSRKSKITLEEEVSCLKLYLQLEQLRFESTLKSELNVNIDQDLSKIYIPSLLIQPFVENAFKHGVFHKLNDKKIEIEFSLNDLDSILICKVKDNGIGREKSKSFKKNKSHRSIGISNTEKRFNLLNKNNESPIGLEIVDLYDNDKSPAGTLVILQIPLL